MQGGKVNLGAGPNHKASAWRDPFKFSAEVRRIEQIWRQSPTKSRFMKLLSLVWVAGKGLRPENVVWPFGAGRTGST
jgi:hypothetical protein